MTSAMGFKRLRLVQSLGGVRTLPSARSRSPPQGVPGAAGNAGLRMPIQPARAKCPPRGEPVRRTHAVKVVRIEHAG